MLEASFVILCILALIGTISLILMAGSYCIKKQKALREIVENKRKTMQALKIMKGYTYKKNFWKCGMNLEELAEAEVITKQAGYTSYGEYENLEYLHKENDFYYGKLEEYVKLGYEPAFMVLVKSSKSIGCPIVSVRSLTILQKLKEEKIINNIFMEVDKC